MTTIANRYASPDSRFDTRFVEVIRESAAIKDQCQLLLWLQGELQSLLPHELLAVAHGNFASGDIQYEVISAIPDSPNTSPQHLGLDALICDLFARWNDHGRVAFSLDTTGGLLRNRPCQCEVHRMLHSMRSVLVHGMRDERAQQDLIYVIFQTREIFSPAARRMFEMLLPHIDFVSRRIPDSGARPLVDGPVALGQSPLERAGLSLREIEVMEWVKQGKTNYEIGLILDISPYTVKNHLQRIFRKIDVISRAQAVARVGELVRAGH